MCCSGNNVLTITDIELRTHNLRMSALIYAQELFSLSGHTFKFVIDGTRPIFELSAFLTTSPSYSITNIQLFENTDRVASLSGL